jgi:prepilin-type N-terminal cleavage/methylation domain-containing protein
VRARFTRGFSTIEVLVAVAILAVALLALISLQIQVSSTYVRQRDMREAISAQRSALALLDGMNIAERRSGEVALSPDSSVSWRARQLTNET